MLYNISVNICLCVPKDKSLYLGMVVVYYKCKYMFGCTER